MTIPANRPWLGLLALLALTAVAGAPDSRPQRHSGDQFFARIERDYAIFFLERNPVVGTYLGGSAVDPVLAEVDTRLRDHSAEVIAREDAGLLELRRRFRAVRPESLSASRRIDREVALAQIEFLLRQHGQRRYQERAIDTYMDEPFRGIDWQLQVLTDLGGGAYGTAAEWRRVIRRLHAIPRYLATARHQLTAGIERGNTADWRVIEAYGVEAAAANATWFARDLPALAAERLKIPEREALLAELRDAAAAAGTAYGSFRGFVLTAFHEPASAGSSPSLKPQYRVDRYAAGSEEYDWAIRNNLRLETSSARLYEESWPVVEATRTEMVALAGEIAASRGWPLAADGPATVRSVFGQLLESAPADDEALFRGYRETGERLLDYARRSGLFDVPADYRLAVIPTPEPLKASVEGAAYYPAPPLSGLGVGHFYLTATGGDRGQLRANNFSAMADLAAHEGFPGHDWHYKIMTEHRASIALIRWLVPGAVEDSSSMWQDSMAAEGWALYSEALLAEPQPGFPAGFYSPEERLYQLQGKLYRDLRVRLDTGLHTGRIGFDEAIDLYSTVVDFEPGSCHDPAVLAASESKRTSCDVARSAIFRYSRWPTQAITYRLGKEQIQALRAEAARRLGERFDAKRFHLEFMKQGTIPAGYFGTELLRKLEADTVMTTN
ncbi:MAG: DUF885 domain-containing protein [Gammaproteobacteria bacterium]|nr:DUF885 domain-containing protein [Gammaproteobacteria bacterium]